MRPTAQECFSNGRVDREGSYKSVSGDSTHGSSGM